MSMAAQHTPEHPAPEIPLVPPAPHEPWPEEIPPYHEPGDEPGREPPPSTRPPPEVAPPSART